MCVGSMGLPIHGLLVSSAFKATEHRWGFDSCMIDSEEGHHRDCDTMKRIPRIKFPKRHPQPPPPDAKSTSQVTSAPSSQMTDGTSKVPAPPRNMAVGGKASLQPKRTPVSDREIEAILLGGCF